MTDFIEEWEAWRKGLVTELRKVAEEADARLAALDPQAVALAEACDLAEEAIGYVNEYFQDKWNMLERLQVLKSKIPPEVYVEFWTDDPPAAATCS
jgi:hypothetical protein